jgi:hypothetical protein
MIKILTSFVVSLTQDRNKLTATVSIDILERGDIYLRRYFPTRVQIIFR